MRIGETIGMLTVEGTFKRRGYPRYILRCECGNRIELSETQITRTNVRKHCGCLYIGPVKNDTSKRRLDAIEQRRIEEQRRIACDSKYHQFKAGIKPGDKITLRYISDWFDLGRALDDWPEKVFTVVKVYREVLRVSATIRGKKVSAHINIRDIWSEKEKILVKAV